MIPVVDGSEVPNNQSLDWFFNPKNNGDTLSSLVVTGFCPSTGRERRYME